MPERPRGVSNIVYLGNILILILSPLTLIAPIAWTETLPQENGTTLGVSLAFIAYSLIALILLYKMKKAGYWMVMAWGTVVLSLSAVFLLQILSASGYELRAGLIALLLILFLVIVPVGAALTYLFSKRQLFQ